MRAYAKKKNGDEELWGVGGEAELEGVSGFDSVAERAMIS